MSGMSETLPSASGSASGSVAGSVAHPMPQAPQAPRPDIIPYNDILAKCAEIPRKPMLLKPLLAQPVG
jgi:hypothetical protein